MGQAAMENAGPVESNIVSEKECNSESETLSASQNATDAKEKRQSEEEEHDNHEYPPKWKLALITTAMCLAVFCMALDNNIIATAVPKITDRFGSVDDIGWYATAYLLTTCSLQLVYGNLYKFYSLKWTFLVALSLFELGSLVCAVTPTSTGLVLGRAVAGMGAAGIYSGAALIISYCVPLRRRPAFMGFISAMYGIASIVGPLLGGAFTDGLSWRWCFYINLPFGGVTAFFIIFFLENDKKGSTGTAPLAEQLQSLDPEGTTLFIGSIVCLLLALQWGGTEYAWANGRIIALLIIAGLSFIGFVAIQIWKQERATVSPRVIKNRSVWSSCVFSAFLGGSFFVLIFYLPLWFQAIKNTSAVDSGIRTLPMILGMVVFSLISGTLVTLIGQYAPFMYLSSILMAIGAGLMSTWKPNTGSPEWIGYQVLYGAGVGFGMQQTMIAIQASLPQADRAIGTAIMMCSQILGGAVFIGVAQNVFQNQLVRNIIAANLAGLDARTIMGAGATQIRQLVPETSLPALLQAYNDALMQTFYVSVAMGALSIIGAGFVEWHSVKDASDKKDSPAA